MPKPMLTVVAEMLAKPGKEDELRRELLALIEPTRREQGCVQYDLHVGATEPGRFVFYENWTSRQKLDLHLETPHLVAFRAKVGDLLAEPVRITTYTRIA